MPPAAILDVDGTLVDTNYHHALAWYRLHQHGELLPVLAHPAIGMGGDQLVEALAGERVESEKGDEIRSAEKAAYAALIEEVEPLSPAPAADRGPEAARPRGSARKLGQAGRGRSLPRAARRARPRRRLDHERRRRGDQARARPGEGAVEKAGGGEAVMVGDSTWDARRPSGPDSTRSRCSPAASPSRSCSRPARAAASARSRSCALARRIAHTRLKLRQHQADGHSLGNYRAKRDFEDEGAAGRRLRGRGRARFVVQEHNARNLHWDLRLEHDGALASWALPRGVPEHPDENRLAVHTEDHPLEYLEFEGEIPGASTGRDDVGLGRGTFEAEKFRENEVIATFHGERVQGRYALFQTRDKDWLIHRMDPPEDPGYEPMPDRLEPMLARSGQLPRDEQKYGLRGQVGQDPHRALQRPRPPLAPGPQLHGLHPALSRGARAEQARSARGGAILDGEIVAFDDEGRPSFERLQTRMHLASDSAVQAAQRDTPATYVIFDLLYLDGHSTLPLPYEERRALLDRLELEGPAWRAPAYHRGEGSALLEATERLGIEGIVAKQLGCPLRAGAPGQRLDQDQERPHAGRCDRRLDSGRGRPQRAARSAGGRDDRGGQARLRRQGRHGLHRGDAQYARPRARVASQRRQPVRGTPAAQGHCVRRAAARGHGRVPQWTRSGTLRAPSFKGLRPDKDPQDCTREGRVREGRRGNFHFHATSDLERRDQPA